VSLKLPAFFPKSLFFNALSSIVSNPRVTAVVSTSLFTISKHLSLSVLPCPFSSGKLSRVFIRYIRTSGNINGAEEGEQIEITANLI
jgi:hypothetical protein